MLSDTTPADTDDQPTLLLVDDDAMLRTVLARALAARGFRVLIAQDFPSAIALARAEPPEFAVLDLKLPGGSGIALMRQLLSLDPCTRVVLLTGYASIATAIDAIKQGASYYLTKPATVADVVSALREGAPSAAISEKPLSVNRLEWEHIQRVLAANRGNVSATARQLGMHRRTLQRKLSKRPVREATASTPVEA